MSIMDFFPKGMTPRPLQVDMLERFEKVFHTHDVIGIEASTAFGKSACAQTIAAWVNSQGLSVALTKPTKILVNQDEASYPDFPVLKSSWDMPCDTYSSVGRAKIKAGKWWKEHAKTCHGCAAYAKALVVAKKGPAMMCNTYTYLAHRAYKDVLVMDEGHNVVGVLQDLHTKKWWKSDTLEWPAQMWERKQIGEWISEMSEVDVNRHKLRPLVKELGARVPKHSIIRTAETLRGKLTECLKLVPIDMRDSAPLLWPRSVKKIVFMSATINQKDLDMMGLGVRRCVILPSASPIPKENRPIYPVCATHMSFRAPASKLQKLADFIEEKMEQHPERGIVHLPYEVAKDLRKVLAHPRILWHTKLTKLSQFSAYKRKEGAVMICSGMHEGVDLVGDLGRWQIIGKIPWPSLADPAVADWAKRDGAAYVWETLKQVIQACGRICRTPTDFGVTYIYDASFKRLLREADKEDLLPEWWREALVGDADEN